MIALANYRELYIITKTIDWPNLLDVFLSSWTYL